METSLVGSCSNSVQCSILSYRITSEPMECPIDDLFDEEWSDQWVMASFHPDGLTCPGCRRDIDAGRRVRRTSRSKGDGVSLSSGSPGGQRLHRNHRSEEAASSGAGDSARAGGNGEPSTVLAKELGISRTTVHTLRRAVQHNAQQRQPDTPLDDQDTETDAMFQHAEETRNEAPRSNRFPATAGQPAAGVRHRRTRPSADGGQDERAGTAPGGAAYQPRYPGSARHSLYRCAGGGLHR